MLYKQILAELAANNCKLTVQRRDILKVLVRAKTHLSARQIFDRLRKTHPQISFDTVYRNLAVMKQLHLVNQLDFQDGRNRYELNRRQDHHHHMICLKCGGAWNIPGCPLDHLDVHNNFKVINHRFEIFGYCQACQSE